MMPIIWRYLLGQYLKVLCLSVLTFIAVLFVIRLHQLAELAALGAEPSTIILFAICMIPHILPIAMPVSCLISSILLFQKLSHTEELTAMRACGMGLRHITQPILLAGALLSLINFFVASELSTQAHLVAHKMHAEVAHINPLMLLQQERMVNQHEVYSNMRTIRSGEEAEDMTLVLYNPNSRRLNLLCAKKLDVKKSEKDAQQLNGQLVSIVSNLDSKRDNNYDHIFIENQHNMSTAAESFTHLIKRAGGVRLSTDVLQLRMLLLRADRAKAKMEKIRNGQIVYPPSKASDPSFIKRKLQNTQRRVNQCYSEIFRRFSLGIAVFSFTLMGCAFGIDIGRHKRRRGLLWVAGLSIFILSSFSIAKSIDRQLILPAILYILPHCIVIPFSIWTLQRTTRGVE